MKSREGRRPIRAPLSRRGFCGMTAIALLGTVGCGSSISRAISGKIDDPFQPLGDDGGTGTTDGPPSWDSDGGTCASDSINAGPGSAIASGSALRLTDEDTYDVWLCRDARGLYALNNECTHASCPLKLVSGPRFYCRCHGAEFDFNGEHPTAPASQPLDHFAVCVDATGNAVVDINTVVDPQTRR